MQTYEENRTAYLSFVLTPTFDRQLRAFAKARGMTVSRLVRTAVAAQAQEDAKDRAKVRCYSESNKAKEPATAG
jgi:post-segregation antitoxin (ccd killing protein)